MKVKNNIFKKQLLRKAISFTMVLMMIVNLMCGYCAATKITTKTVKAATTNQTQAPYRNVM